MGSGPTTTTILPTEWSKLIQSAAGSLRYGCTGGPPPPNDDIDNSTPITPLPYTTAQDTTYATIAGDDPIFPCGSSDTGSETVWYAITPAVSGVFHADTFGSGYDTMLALWTGTRGGLTNVACNDDAGGTVQSEVNVGVQAGVHYYLEVAGYAAAFAPVQKPNAADGLLAGGTLNLAVDVAVGPQLLIPSGVPGYGGGWNLSPRCTWRHLCRHDRL